MDVPSCGEPWPQALPTHLAQPGLLERMEECFQSDFCARSPPRPVRHGGEEGPIPALQELMVWPRISWEALVLLVTASQDLNLRLSDWGVSSFSPYPTAPCLHPPVKLANKGGLDSNGQRGLWAPHLSDSILGHHRMSTAHTAININRTLLLLSLTSQNIRAGKRHFKIVDPFILWERKLRH